MIFKTFPSLIFSRCGSFTSYLIMLDEILFVLVGMLDISRLDVAIWRNFFQALSSACLMWPVCSVEGGVWISNCTKEWEQPEP